MTALTAWLADADHKLPSLELGASAAKTWHTRHLDETFEWTHARHLDETKWTQAAKLVAVDGESDRFGYEVSISGDNLVVSSYQDDDAGYSSGTACVFKKNGSAWTQAANCFASDDAAVDHFGQSVSIAGDIIVVGAHFDDDGGSKSGLAYVFEKSSGSLWTQTAKLIAATSGLQSRSLATPSSSVSFEPPSPPPPRAAGDYSGRSVSIADSIIVVGAEYGDDGGYKSGSAYVFEKSGSSLWTQTAKLISAAVGDGFGRSVSTSGDAIIVGAPYDDSGYVFAMSGGAWTQTAKLLASDATFYRFGHCVSISGNAVIVGAPYEVDGNPQAESGSAYVFAQSGNVWTQAAKLIAADSEAYSFGLSVSISGDIIVVGANLDEEGGYDDKYAVGSTYIFEKSAGEWTQTSKLLVPVYAYDDQFGHSVSISGDTVVVGAYAGLAGGYNSGSAYVFNLSPTSTPRPLPRPDVPNDSDNDSGSSGSGSSDGGALKIALIALWVIAFACCSCAVVLVTLHTSSRRLVSVVGGFEMGALEMADTGPGRYAAANQSPPTHSKLRITDHPPDFLDGIWIQSV